MTAVSEHSISIGNYFLTQVSLSKILSKLIECVLFDLQQMSCLPVPVQDGIFPNMSKEMKGCFDAILSIQEGIKSMDLSQIRTVALVLGGSPTVPQAIFEVKFSPSIISFSDSDSYLDNKENNNEAAAVQRFFHNFIQCDLCGSLTLPPTKMFVFFEAPRIPPQNWLVPKMDFNLNKKVKTHKRVIITSDIIANEEFSHDTNDTLTPAMTSCPLFISRGGVSSTLDKQANEDLIWYTAPISICGYAS